MKYREYIDPVGETYAYCLLPNHFHFMVQIREELELQKLKAFADLEIREFHKILSQKFSHLFNGYTQAYNKRFDRRGSLFMNRFKRKHIDSDKYYTQLMIYIHNNPVNHGFVKSPSDWPYSSWHQYLDSKNSDPSIQKGKQWFASQSDFVNAHLDSSEGHATDLGYLED